MAQIVARATNQQSTEETFILRKLYKDRAFPTYGAKSIDFWYEKPMYGRIDSQEKTPVRHLAQGSFVFCIPPVFS